MDLNDELLCAFLDDELDPPQRERVAAALAGDAGAQLRLERMRSADRQLKSALPSPGNDHFEAAMAARIRATAPLRTWRRDVLPWAAAAAIAGLFAGYLIPAALSTGDAYPTAALAPSMQRFLESSRSDTAAQAGAPATVLTFEAGDGRYCRVFRSRSTGSGSGEGLACRDTEGWKLIAWDATAVGSAAAFRPAGASTLIDGAMDQLGGKPAVNAQEEQSLIASGWHRP